MSDPANQSNAGDEGPGAEERLSDFVDQVEQRLDARRSRKEVDDKSLRLSEKLNMIIFHTLFIAALAGIQGYMEIGLESPARMRTGSGTFLEQRLNDLAGVWEGLVRQFPEFWHLDLLLWITVVMLAFGVKRRATQRRYFSLAVMVTVIVFGLIYVSMITEKGPGMM